MTTALSKRKSAPQYGISLIEVSVVLGVLGIAALALPQLFLLTQPSSSDIEREQLTRAHNAIMGFVLSEQRLPCPAPDSVSGEESCQYGSVGYFPFKTLGLPDRQSGAIHYGVMRNASANADLAERRARLNHIDFDHQGNHRLSLTSSTSPDQPKVGRGVYAKDFCQALKNIAGQPLDERYLHIKDPVQTAQGDKNVAYAVALPGVGRNFEGAQRSHALAFDSPARMESSSYHDKVLINTPESLWQQLACSPLIASTHHYTNVMSATSLHVLALTEFSRQLNLRKKLATANLVAGALTVANTVLSVISANVNIHKKKGHYAKEQGAKEPDPNKIKLANKAVSEARLAALVTETTTFPVSIINFALVTVPSHQRATENYDHISTVLLPDVIRLSAQMKNRFEENRREGIFLPEHIFTSSSP